MLPPQRANAVVGARQRIAEGAAGKPETSPPARGDDQAG